MYGNVTCLRCYSEVKVETDDTSPNYEVCLHTGGSIQIDLFRCTFFYFSFTDGNVRTTMKVLHYEIFIFNNMNPWSFQPLSSKVDRSVHSGYQVNPCGEQHQKVNKQWSNIMSNSSILQNRILLPGCTCRGIPCSIGKPCQTAIAELIQELHPPFFGACQHHRSEFP